MPRRRFCSICGADLDETSPHFSTCLECYLKEHPLFTVPGNLNLKVCMDCGSYSRREEWKTTSENDFISIIKEAILEYLLIPLVKKQDLEFDIILDENSIRYNSKKRIDTLEFEILGSLKTNKRMSHVERLKVKIHHDLCENCTKLRSGMYYKSILQLRVDDPSYFPFLNTVINQVQHFVEKQFEQDHGQYIVKMEDKERGVNLYLSSNELMNHIISFLKNQYHFLLKRSKKLVGRDIQKGKNLYRLTSLLKFLPIQKGDMIIIDRTDEYVVTNISKKIIVLKNKTGKKLVKNFEDFFKLKYNIIRYAENSL
ncbi:MAG: NMD3-related protein [Promethearchaeota archaeon]